MPACDCLISRNNGVKMLTRNIKIWLRSLYLRLNCRTTHCRLRRLHCLPVRDACGQFTGHARVYIEIYSFGRSSNRLRPTRSRCAFSFVSVAVSFVAACLRRPSIRPSVRPFGSSVTSLERERTRRWSRRAQLPSSVGFPS